MINNPARLQTSVCIQVLKSSSPFGEVRSRIVAIKAMMMAAINMMMAKSLKRIKRKLRIAYPSLVPREEVWYLLESKICRKPGRSALTQRHPAMPMKNRIFFMMDERCFIGYFYVVGASFLSSSGALLIPSRASISISTYCFLRPYIFREYSRMIFAARSLR